MGATPVQLIVTDTQSAKDTCAATITVVDNTPPSFTNCPQADIQVNTDPGQCTAVVNYAITATDNCPGAGVVATPPSGSTFPKGVTPVQVIATDASGNKDTCDFNVIVNDNEPPVASCPADIIVIVDAGQSSKVVNYVSTATDNCPGVTSVCNPLSGSAFPIGVTPVECIATDASSLTDTCIFNAVVLCACNCHADPANCDGVQDITDVVQTINVAFRGAAEIFDPNANCPYETTDTNCSNSTDIVDVVKMVNVAFRGANAATEFCDPCP